MVLVTLTMILTNLQAPSHLTPLPSLLTGFSGLFVAKIGLTGLGKPLATAVAETPTLLFSGFTERGQCQWKTEPSTDRLSSRPHFCIPI